MGYKKEDYEKDGILHCGVCNKPKFVKYDLFGEERLIPCLCDCEANERKEEHDAFLDEQRLIKVNDMRVNNIKDRERRHCRFEDAEQNKSITVCKKYVDNWESMKEKNIGILMWGQCGNGKSFAAACIANALIEKGVPALMTSFPAILGDSNNTTDIARQMQEFDLVILDDLGAERQSEYALEKVFYIIDERYKSGKPLIVTTNQELDAMKKYRDGTDMAYSRIYDRIFEMCIPMMFSGETRRKATMRDKTKTINEIFARGISNAG